MQNQYRVCDLWYTYAPSHTPQGHYCPDRRAVRRPRARRALAEGDAVAASAYTPCHHIVASQPAPLTLHTLMMSAPKPKHFQEAKKQEENLLERRKCGAAGAACRAVCLSVCLAWVGGRRGQGQP